MFFKGVTSSFLDQLQLVGFFCTLCQFQTFITTCLQDSNLHMTRPLHNFCFSSFPLQNMVVYHQSLKGLASVIVSLKTASCRATAHHNITIALLNTILCSLEKVPLACIYQTSLLLLDG